VKGGLSFPYYAKRYFLTVSETNLPSLSIFVGSGEEHFGVFLSNGE